MPDFRDPVARFWFDLPDLSHLPRGPALSDALLDEEARRGITRDVAWAYAEAMPALVRFDRAADVLPLAFGRGALRAAALTTPVEIEGLYHVQTRSPDVCREMGSRVPSFTVRGEACVRALIEHGTAVRRVIANDCTALELDAPFELVVPPSMESRARGWFEWYGAARYRPIARLDLDVWLCWDHRDSRPFVVKGHDKVIAGRFGPRDVVPDPDPPPWAERDAAMTRGHGWAATMARNNAAAGVSIVAARTRGWCRLHVDAIDGYHDALRSAWRDGRALQEVTAGGTPWAGMTALRFEGAVAHFAWVGQERILRVRGGDLVQLTTDHDLHDAARRGDPSLTREMLAAMTDVPDVTTRGLPMHAPDEGECPVERGDRFVLLDDTTQRLLDQAAGGRDALVKRISDGDPRKVARWMRYALEHSPIERPVLVVDAGATIDAD